MKKMYTYTLVIILLALVIFFAISFKVEQEINHSIIQEEKLALPTVDSFDNLYNLLKIEENYNAYNGSDMGQQHAMKEAVTDDIAMTTDEARGGGEDIYSTTNIQVANVDEGDIVKTDGRYLYYISNQKVVIVDGQNPEELKIVSEIEYEQPGFYPNELYINNNKLIVIGGNIIYEVMYRRNE